MSDWDDELDDKPREDESFAQRVIPDFVKKAIMTGVGAVFMTEDGLRGALTDMKVPKEAMSSLIAQADKTKNEVIQTLARELRGFLDGLELEDLLKKSLEGATFEIHTTIRVIKDGEGEVGLAVVDKKTTVTRDDDEADEDPKPAKKKSTRKRKSSKKSSSSKTSSSEDEDEN